MKRNLTVESHTIFRAPAFSGLLNKKKKARELHTDFVCNHKPLGTDNKIMLYLARKRPNNTFCQAKETPEKCSTV